MRKNKTCPDQEWKQLPTEELDQILQAELEKDHPEDAVVLPILRILEEREKDYPVEKTPEVLAMLGKLSELEPSPKQSNNRRGWIAGIAAVAAAVCIVIMALPRTVGAESIFDVLFRWTSSIFEFIDPNRNENAPSADAIFVTDHPGLQQLHDKVTELGVTEPVVPMWIPEGVELLKLKATPLVNNGYKVDAVFKSNEIIVSFGYRISRDITTRFEKEDTAIELYDYAGVNHFLLENDEKLSATWSVEGVECSIVANVDKKDIYTMIKSIYWRQLK